MKRIISIAVIWGMLAGNTAFAYEFKAGEPIKPENMLAPVVNLDAVLFKQGFEQGLKIDDLAKEDGDIAKQIKQLISGADRLANDSFAKKFLKMIEQASDLFAQGNAHMRLSENSVKRKDIKRALNDGIVCWKKSANCLDSIDLEKIDLVIPDNKKQAVYTFLRFKAEVLFNIVESDSKLDSNPYAKMDYYVQIRELLEKAIALPGDYIDFQGMSFLANSCANLSTDPRNPTEKQLEFCEEAVTYFEEALDMQSTFGLDGESDAVTDQVYYSYFSSLYFAGDICREMNDYAKAVKFYEKVIPLCSRLRIYDIALSAIRKVYDNYYRTLLTMSKDLESVMDKDSVEDRAKLDDLLNKTILIANESMDYFQPQELSQGKALGAMSCIFSAQEKRVRESLRARDWVGVSSRLQPIILQLEQMNKIVCKDQHNNYAIANMNIELIELTHDIIHEYMKINGSSDSSIAGMVKIIGNDFLSGFLEKVKSGEYNDVLKKIKKKNALNDAALWRALISGSSIYNKTCRYMEKSLIPNNVRTRTRQEESIRIENNKKFRQDFSHTARMMLAFVYLQKDNNRQAVAQIRDAANRFKDDFIKDDFLVKHILTQAVLAEKKGEDFITDLLLSLAHQSVSDNLVQHRAQMSPEAVGMLKGIFNNNPNIRENNKNLAEALGIVMDDQKSVEPIVKNDMHDGREVIRSFEVMRRSVSEALNLVYSQSGNKKIRSKKKKGKAVKKISLHVKSAPVRQLENALERMISADKKRGVKPVFGYLKYDILNEPVLKNRFAMGALAWTVANMDAEQSLEILKAYTKSFNADTLSGEEIAKALGAVESFEVYKKQMKGLEKRIDNSPKLKVRGSVYAGLSLEQFKLNMDNFEKRAAEINAYIPEKNSRSFSGQDIFFSQNAYKQTIDEWAAKYTEKIKDLLAELRSQAESIEKDRLKAKAEEFLADVEKLDYALYEAQAKAAYEAKNVSPAEGILCLRQWDKDIAMLIPAEEISSLPEIQEALDNTSYKWDTYNQEMRSQQKKINFIVKNKISFSISEDLSKIRFVDESLTPNDMRRENDIIDAMCEVVEALLLRNPDLNIQADVSGKNNSSSKVFFLPLMGKVKARMIKVQRNKYKAKQIIDELDMFFKKYETAVKNIIESDMSRIEKIRQLDLLLDDDYNETVPDKILDNPELVFGDYEDEWEKRYDDIDEQRLALQIGNGALRVEVIGDYNRLKFILVKDISIESVDSEIREIWQGALAFNPELEMEVLENVDPESPWVVEIADIWDQEYELMVKDKKKEDIINQPVEADSKSLVENIPAIAQAI